VVVSAESLNDHHLRVLGSGQASRHQHVTAARNLLVTGAADAAARALETAAVNRVELRYAAIYDSFTVTLAILLEDLGLSPPGRAGALAGEGLYAPRGTLPLNTHGGLLSYGHCGVAGALAHVVEAHHQLTGRSGDRQALDHPGPALLHGDGGVMSAHVSMVVTP